MTTPPFEIICEIEPPARPDVSRLHDQLEVLGPLTSRFLVPDNHTARATVSSLVLASDIDRAGGRSIACLNARDRNLLGLRRDLLTAQYCGIDDLLLVYGDRPARRSTPREPGLTVRAMLDEVRTTSPDHAVRAAVTSRLEPLPTWKRDADALFVQVTYELGALLRWRDAVRFDGPIYAGVLVPSSARMARRLGDRVPELRMPAPWLDALAENDLAGVALATHHLEQIRSSGAFDGAHLVCGSRARDVVAHLAVDVEPCGDEQRRVHRTPWRSRALA